MRKHNYFVNLFVSFIAFVGLSAAVDGVHNAGGFVVAFVIAHIIGYVMGGLAA